MVAVAAEVLQQLVVTLVMLVMLVATEEPELHLQLQDHLLLMLEVEVAVETLPVLAGLGVVEQGQHLEPTTPLLGLLTQAVVEVVKDCQILLAKQAAQVS
jgi:hypothetical protein